MQIGIRINGPRCTAETGILTQEKNRRWAVSWILDQNPSNFRLELFHLHENLYKFEAIYTNF